MQKKRKSKPFRFSLRFLYCFLVLILCGNFQILVEQSPFAPSDLKDGILPSSTNIVQCITVRAGDGTVTRGADYAPW